MTTMALELAEKHPELVVGGKVIEQRHYRSFELFSRGHTAKEISEKLLAEGYVNCAVSTVAQWQRQDWHHALSERHLGVAQKQFAVGMANMQEEILQAYKDVVSGSNTEDRTANARIQGVKAFMEAGTNPILNKKTNIEIHNDNRTQILRIDQDKLRMKTQEELQDILEAGKVPDELLIAR